MPSGGDDVLRISQVESKVVGENGREEDGGGEEGGKCCRESGGGGVIGCKEGDWRNPSAGLRGGGGGEGEGGGRGGVADEGGEVEVGEVQQFGGEEGVNGAAALVAGCAEDEDSFLGLTLVDGARGS